MDDNGEIKELQILINKPFVIRLESKPTTGFTWSFKLDEQYLRATDKKYSFNSDKIGGSGSEEYEFIAIKTGKTNLEFTYKRSWDESILKKIIYSLNIKESN